MTTDPVPEPYNTMMDILVRVMEGDGVRFLYDWRDDYGINPYYPSRSGEFELTLDYGTLGEVRTPAGQLCFGSHVCGSHLSDERLQELLEGEFEVTMLRPQRDDSTTDQLTYQLAYSGPVYGLRLREGEVSK